MNPYAYSVLAFGFCSFLIGLFVWLRLQSGIGFKYFLFSASSGLWGMIIGLCLTDAVSYSSALFCARTSNAIASLIPVAWYFFTMEFTGLPWTRIRKGTAAGLCVVSAFVILNAYSHDFIPRVRTIMNFKYYSVPSWIHYLFTVHFFLGSTLGLVNLFVYLRSLVGDQRKSTQYLIAATTVGFVGGSLSFFPIYGIPVPQYGMFVMPLYPVFMAIAMMRFDLFNVEDLAQAAHKDKLAALGILTASINHEIRSPLFVMRALVDTEAKDSPLQTKLSDQINRITGIVSRLTHFAKKGVEEAAQIEAIDIKEVLIDIRPLFQHQLNYQQIEYNQEIPNDLPKVLADRRYLEEILFNLILNACQALKSTSNPKITLRALKEASSIVIAVEDNGFGIPPEQLKTIFKPFHTTKQEGTGLGLYITKQLVEKCGAKIEVQSQLGCGAQFKVNFRT